MFDGRCARGGMIMNISTILLSILSSLSGAVTITIVFIKSFGNKILESQFEKSLENYKYRINSRFDRISKIHEKEFEVLPKIWKGLIQTNTIFYSMTSHFQEYPDINRMNDTERKELYENYSFKQSTIDKIEISYDKLKEFIEFDYWQKYSKITKEYNQVTRDYLDNRIFLTQEIDEKIDQIRKGFISMISTLKCCNLNGEINYELKMKANEEQEKIEPILKEVGRLIQTRLCFSEAYEK